MADELVIVESPTKARTLSRFLGDGYDVAASLGHVRDLPQTHLGVDIDDNFKPEYVIPPSKSKIIKELRKASKGVSKVILATDPDREGEAIAWHIHSFLSEKNKLKDTNVAR